MDNAKLATLKLLDYCRANNWAGYDPYDALNSRAFEVLPMLKSRVPRLILTQALKRSPINIRRLLGVPKTHNPKAIALFLMALVKLSRAGIVDAEKEIPEMIDRLIALRSTNVPYWCWGYSFPWQTRAMIVPRGAPNVVCTTFAADAFVSAYEERQDSRCLSMAVSAAEYVVNELYWNDGAVASFSYPQPGVRSKTHNANLLAAGMLCRIYKHTRDEKFLVPALKVARYSVSKQHADGSWDYGEGPSQRWIDNFHTGYNLCALQYICRYGETAEFDESIRLGLEFYRGHFFREDGAPRYFHNQTFPIDIHAVAQSIITLVEFRDHHSGNVALARSVFQWAMAHMWDDRGFFYYQVLRFGTIRTSYMRWAQAWMLLALSMLVCDIDVNDPEDLNSVAFTKVC